MPISLGIGTAITRGGGLYGPQPQLDLNFASLLSLTPSVGPTPSFTRASTGTYFDASGVLTTAAINGPRFDHVYNGSSWVSKGLLVEEQRTNSVINSNNISGAGWIRSNGSLISNSQNSPDNTVNASEYVGNNGAGYFEFYQQLSLISGIYTNSIFLKSSGTGADIVSIWGYAGNSAVGWFNLANGTSQSGTESGISYTATIKNCGNGWFRCSITNNTATTCAYTFPCRPMTAMGGTTSLTGNGVRSVYVYGAQLEAGAFPTSYIPTTSAAVTRSADVCQITGGDFSGFYNQSEGSFAVEGDTPASGAKSLVSADNATANESTILRTLATDPLFIVTDGGVAQASVDAGTVVSGTGFKLAAAYTINDFAVSKDGAAVATDSSGTIPTPTQLNVGSDASGNYVCGHIARLRYYNTRLLNSQLVELST